MAKQQGPEVKLELSCFNCEHMLSEAEWDDIGDRSWCHSCGHPDMPADKNYIGHHTRTPAACPLRAAAIAAAVRPIGFVSIEAVKEAANGLDRESAMWLCQVIDDA